MVSRSTSRYVCGTALALVLSLGAFLASAGTGRTVVLAIVAVSWVAAVGVGIGRNTPGRVESWRYLAAAGVAFGVGLFLRDDPTRAATVPLAPELLITVGYVLAVVGVVKWAFRADAVDTLAILDTVLVTLGMMFVSWVLLVAPALETTDDMGALIINGLYPAIDAGLLTMTYFGLLDRGRKNPSLVVLVLALGAILIGDLLYAISSARGIAPSSSAVESAYLAAFVLVAAAALHPSMARVGRLVEARTTAGSRHRMTVLVTLVAICAALPLVGSAAGPVDIAVRSVFLSIILVGMFVRGEFALERVQRSEDRARHDATHDSLTGLPDRSTIAEIFRRARAQRVSSVAPTTVLFADLDNFKAVNDSYGHRAGDELIREAARRIRAEAASHETVVRYAGDEFVVVTRATREDAEELAERISAAFAEPFALTVATIYLTVSVGIASAVDADVAPDDLIREADSAMYFAKSQGSATHAFFDESLRTAATSALELGTALRGAIARGEMSVHYQPIVSVDTGIVYVYEALLRWNRNGVWIRPDVFVPVAESTNQISAIGRWVLDTALGDLARLRAAGRPDMTMSVNLSVLQLRDENLPDVVAELLDEHGLSGDCLGLEVTESALIADPVVAHRVLNRLASMGILLVLDDFGMGYSSLGRLRDLPISVLKIDKSFVGATARDAKAVSLVSAIAAMADALEIRTVAEGVETPDQAEIVARLGISFAQGYLYGRPQPIETFVPIIAAVGATAEPPVPS